MYTQRERERESDINMVRCSQLPELCYKKFTLKILKCKYPEKVINILV